MTYNCTIERQPDGMYAVHFPDMENVMTYGTDFENAQEMAKEALEAVLETDIANGFPIPEPKYMGGIAIEVSPKIAFAIALKTARGNRTQKEAAISAGMSYQQYQRLENPKKTNPTLEMICRLQKAFNRKFIAL